MAAPAGNRVHQAAHKAYVTRKSRWKMKIPRLRDDLPKAYIIDPYTFWYIIVVFGRF